MGKCKTFRYIQAYSRIFMHIHTYSGIIQAYSGIFRTLCNPGIFRTLSIQNQKHIPNGGIFRILVHLEPYQTSTMDHFAKIVNRYNYFRNISFSRSLLCEKSMYFLNKCLIFTPEVFDIKTYRPRGDR